MPLSKPRRKGNPDGKFRSQEIYARPSSAPPAHRGAALPFPKILRGKLVWTNFRLRNQVVWGESVLRWISEGLRSGDVFFDVGAHHGWMSMVAARRTGRTGRVVAFEPSPSSIDFLRYHKRMNRITQMEQ